MQKTRHLFTTVIFSLWVGLPAALACDLCKKNQPAPLRNITHGTGPQSDWDFLIIAGGLLIVSLTLFYSLKYLIKPRENSPDHIKNRIISQD